MQYFGYLKQLHDLELYQDLKQLVCVKLYIVNTLN